MEERIGRYRDLLFSGQEATEKARLVRLAAELDEDPHFAEHFFTKFRGLGEKAPQGLLSGLMPLLTRKASQKALKKTHYLLRQKGVELDPLPGGDRDQKEGLLKPIEAFQPLGFLSEIDPLRTRMVGMMIPQTPYGRLFLLALIDPQGLKDLTLSETGKKRLKELLSELEGRSGLRFWEADFPHTAFLVKEAHEWGSALSPKEEEVFGEILRFLEAKGVVGRTPVIRSLMAEERIDYPPLPLPEEMEKIRELIFLLPDVQVLEAFGNRVREVRQGLLVLNERQRQEREGDIVRQALRESYPLDRWERYRRYLEEAAYLHHLKGEKEAALMLYGWAQTFTAGGKYRSPEEHPFLNWLMELVLLGDEEEKGSPSPEREIRTSGGIIIPSWVENKGV